MASSVVFLSNYHPFSLPKTPLGRFWGQNSRLDTCLETCEKLTPHWGKKPSVPLQGEPLCGNSAALRQVFRFWGNLGENFWEHMIFTLCFLGGGACFGRFGPLCFGLFPRISAKFESYFRSGSSTHLHPKSIPGATFGPK